MDPAALLRMLEERSATLATAESLTGGRLAARITAAPGASRSYRGGVIAYATDLKGSLLDVPPDVLARHGAVSGPCARAMAAGTRDRLAVTYAVATTGVAGPDRQEGHPPGTVYVAVAGPGGVDVVALELAGDREAVQERTCTEALAAIGEVLRREEPLLG
ncbi:CinA family protein [Nocardioides coralli]|uniref:CinA family protein n=1 Tax=Nocardioides coralli TaxID=2872154 RepID=UPI0020172AD9|nr:CinA family protein [Nocardioides coralli]